MSKKSSPLQDARKTSSSSASQDLNTSKAMTAITSTTSNTNTSNNSDSLVTELRPHDVIMGRGLSASEYEGNKRLRKMVQSRREDYVNATSREGKQNVAREIIAAVRAQGGRFLRRHVAFGASCTQSVWQAIQDPEEMMTKVKQLLRDMAPEVKERRVQRRRRQAEWARQHAYTNLFPDVPNCPFGSATNENNGTGRSNKPLPPPSAPAPVTGTTRSGLSLSLPPTLTTSLNARPHDLLATTTTTSTRSNTTSVVAPTTIANTNSVPNSLTGIWERAAAATTNIHHSRAPSSPTVSSLTLQDVQRLIVRQQQEQEQQRFRLLESLSASAQAFANTTSSSSSSSALPISSQAATTIDPRLVLLELQRHAGAAPRMALNTEPNSIQRVPATLTLDQALQELHRSSSSSSMNTATDLRNLSEDDLARLVLLERWNSLRR